MNLSGDIAGLIIYFFVMAIITILLFRSVIKKENK